MIPVWLNKPQFEYDIHSLVKAFFPADEVKVFCVEEGTDQTGAVDGEGISIRICFLENGITMEL